jgi:hypothetical protein
MLFRKYPDQILEAFKKLQWQARTANGLPTLILERCGAETIGVRVDYRGAAERLRLGPRLRSLVAYVVVRSKTEHSTHWVGKPATGFWGHLPEMAAIR